MKFENTEVWGFKHALRGMRNPLNSWEKSDTVYDDNGIPIIGENDMKLAKRLISGGSEHRKFLRQIMVSVDITAPLYWWKEFDTYKVGTVANSTSTMHKLASTPITLDCFELGDYYKDLMICEGIDEGDDYSIHYECLLEEFIEPGNTNFYYEPTLIGFLETLRQQYNETNDKKYWKELVRWLPNGWLQTRTVTMNYENLLTIVHQRKNHKLTEWSVDFIEWARSLPYSKEFIFLEGN